MFKSNDVLNFNAVNQSGLVYVEWIVIAAVGKRKKKIESLVIFLTRCFKKKKN